MKCGHVLLLTEFQNQGFKFNLNDENSPMLIKISCKVHIYSTQPEDQFHRVGLPSPALHPL